ncbi:DUF932 domain-containing protein, partial [Burkholderia sp. SIMBA_013]|uniref:DUF932 domain-containing protein n=1 Tax=Burkholderia sp. SIMBA_042 TaxID=3085783 RepID=UPI00397B818E
PAGRCLTRYSLPFLLHWHIHDFYTSRYAPPTKSRIGPNRDEQHAFARSALALRYDPTDAEAPAPIAESQLLAPRRFEDRRDDLWTVFNRVQENLTKGGLHGRSRTGRAMSTRPITGIDQDVKLNRALWMLADAMRQMKV